MRILVTKIELVIKVLKCQNTSRTPPSPHVKTQRLSLQRRPYGPEVIATPLTNTAATISALNRIFTTHGFPETLLSDD
ncbi:hypothetical protein ACTXT7_007961 [Hymenolepis weldensis]